MNFMGPLFGNQELPALVSGNNARASARGDPSKPRPSEQACVVLSYEEYLMGELQ
eukprot:XP_001705705.1 Hypothetical protein GL50803_9324 [Giardia lamblia ATCC 50803]